MIARRKVRILTYGCQMNVYDSDHLLQNLSLIGYGATDEEEDADMIILNTCSVREGAAQKVYSKLGRLKFLKHRRPDLLLVVAGCVAQQEQEALARRVPFVDIVLGPDHISEIVQLVEVARRTGQQVVATRFEEDPERIFSRPEQLKGTVPVSSFVTVMKGCNQFCSYCIVPHTRGREVSKAPEVIVAEVQSLLARGAREVYLLGQNVNRYGMDREDYPHFPELLERIHALPDLSRLRFITSHPRDCTDELIACFGRLEKLAPFCHLPLQSASDRILSAMNRKYDFAHYQKLVAKLRDVSPDINISTDLIVGFPGETDADFNCTLEAAKTIRWGHSYSFMYSPRPGTKAAGMADDVPLTVKKARLEKLQRVLYDTMHEAMERNVGSCQNVLLEGMSQRPSEVPEVIQLTGRTGANYIANVDFPAGTEVTIGSMVPVEITRLLAHSLVGRSVVREVK
jgi:tRNA-2-methylthio-N6-dimethylallyladenosine synthase